MDYRGIHNKDLDLRACADLVVIASSRHSAHLSRQLAGQAFPGLTLIELAPDQPIPADQVRGSAVAVIEVDPANPGSIGRLARFREGHGAIPVIAAIPDAPLALVRSLVRGGIDDVIGLPFSPDELLEVALNVLTTRSVERAPEAPLAPMVAVVRSIGGCGATAIATHLAPALQAAAGSERGALVVDLDLQFGSVAEVLSAAGRGTITDLLEAGHRIDDELVRSVVRTSEDGANVIAAPAEIVPLETVDTDQLLRVIEHLRRSYGHVVLDLPANWTNWTLSAALAADVVLLVVELSVHSLRQAKRRLELFRTVGIPAERVAVVVNRHEKRLFRTISLTDVAATLFHPALGSIALDEPAVSAAQDQGRLVQAINRRSAFAGDIARLADTLLSGPLGART